MLIRFDLGCLSAGRKHDQNQQITDLLRGGFFQCVLRYVSLVHTSQVAGRTQPAADQLFVCFHNVHGLKKRIPLKNWILSCFVSLKSVLFNLLSVFDLFLERRQSTLFHFFFKSVGYFVQQIIYFWVFLLLFDCLFCTGGGGFGVGLFFSCVYVCVCPSACVFFLNALTF